MARKVAQDVAAAPRSAVVGRFERHVSQNWHELTGSNSGGRWGPPGAYSVLYLGRPRDSVAVEAYRHLVDPFAESGMTGDMVAPRRLLACEVSVTEILDLRGDEAQRSLGLINSDLLSEIGSYDACQAIGRVAHQLGLHGVIAPAASGLGETLALFEQHLPADELPVLVAEEAWDVLPADPRRIRLVRGDYEAVYDHFGWRVRGRAWEVGPARLAETHEYFHRQLDDTTAFGGLTSTVAALADALPGDDSWLDSRERLLAMSDLVHEAFAVGASLLTTQRSIESITGYPTYDRHVRAARRLLGQDVHPWVALAALRAAATACMQSQALALAVEAGIAHFHPSQVPPMERPNHRLAALLGGGYAAAVQWEQLRSEEAHGGETWWLPTGDVILSPDAMDGEASEASGLLYRRLFDAAADDIRRAGGLPVVALEDHHEHLRILLAEARGLAPEGLARVGALVEAPGGELLHGGPLDGQVIELSAAPRRAVILPLGSASEVSGEGPRRHVFAVVTTPRRLRAAHVLEGVELPRGEVLAAARTTVFDGDALDSILYLLVDRPEQLGDPAPTFVSVMSSAVAADSKQAAAWLQSADLERVSLVMDTPVTAALRRWCADGATFRSETRLVVAGDDEVRIIAGRLEEPGRRSPLVIIPTTEFGARWFEAARAEDPLLRSVVADDPELFERESSHLDIVLTHLLIEERYVGTGSWRS